MTLPRKDELASAALEISAVGLLVVFCTQWAALGTGQVEPQRPMANPAPTVMQDLSAAILSDSSSGYGPQSQQVAAAR